MSTPGYEFLPAPLWIIHTLHVFTLVLHFVAMNFMVGGIVFLLFGRLDGGMRHPVAQKIIKLFPGVMSATITLGVAPLLFVQLVYPENVYSASIASGWFWLMIVGAGMLTYYLLYAASFSKNQGRVKPFLAVAFLGMLYISVVYSSVLAMAETPDVYHALYASNPEGTSLNRSLAQWIPRWLHMITGSVAVGSFLVGLLARKDEAVFRRVRMFFTYSMALAMVLGFVYLGSLHNIMSSLMSGSTPWVLTVSILFSLGALHMFWKGKLLATGVMVGLSLVGMIVIRHQVRLILLGDVYDPSQIVVQPQWGVFALFVVCFILALAVCAWMAMLFLRQPQEDAG